METKLIQKEDLAKAGAMLRSGELIAFPTETVYGLGADATNETAVRAVYAAKNRPSDNPLIVHVTGPETVLEFVPELDERAEKLMTAFWPGPLTLVFKIKAGSLPAVVTAGLATASFRMPDNALTLELIRQTGRPLVGPSANTSGRPSPTTAQHVYHDLAGKIAGIVEGGPCAVGLESTVLDLSEAQAVILRPGAITQEALSAVIGPVTLDPYLKEEQAQPKSPGMKYKHYAPEVEVQMIDWQNDNWAEALAWAATHNRQVGLLASQEIIATYGEQAGRVYPLSEGADVQAASQQLFAGLRELDQHQGEIDLIFAQTYPETGFGLAYMNRLKKAANQLYF